MTMLNYVVSFWHINNQYNNEPDNTIMIAGDAIKGTDADADMLKMTVANLMSNPKCAKITVTKSVTIRCRYNNEYCNGPGSLNHSRCHESTCNGPR